MSKLANYKKAVGGFVGGLTTELAALLALGVLSGPVSHDIALVLTVLTPLSAALGVAVSPKNVPPK